MRLDPALCERLGSGALTLVRYTTWRRGASLEPVISGANPAAAFGKLQALGEGHAAATAPGRWVWFATGAGIAPEALTDCARADLSAAVIAYRFARSPLEALLRRHAPASLDANLLAPGFRRLGMATWSIELAILPDRPAFVMVPRGHAENFEKLAARELAGKRSEGCGGDDI